MSRFAHTYCSQCGGEFGPGDEGFSHCSDHEQAKPATVDDYMRLADLMAQCFSAFLHPEQGADYAEARNAYNAARLDLHAALVSGLRAAKEQAE